MKKRKIQPWRRLEAWVQTETLKDEDKSGTLAVEKGDPKPLTDFSEGMQKNKKERISTVSTEEVKKHEDEAVPLVSSI